MPAYNIHLRKRLREFAIEHENKIDIDDFMREQDDLADLGIAEPLTLPHCRQILARSPEFKREWAGMYVYDPDTFAQVEQKRKAFHKARKGQKRGAKILPVMASSDEDLLKEIFG